MLKKLLSLIGADLTVIYCVMDGAFGNNNALQMVRQCSLHLISKLRYDAALYFPYDGPQKKRGANKKYGDKLNYNHIPTQYLKETTVDRWHPNQYLSDDACGTNFSQDLLNVVIIVKTNLKTGARAHVVLFSSDLDFSL